MLKLQVNVTEDDIFEGEQHSAFINPIGIAICRQFEQLRPNDPITMSRIYGSMFSGTTEKGHAIKIRLSPVVQDWLLDFDYNRYVSPFTFNAIVEKEV